MKHICRYCGINKEKNTQLGGHVFWCLKNPNRERNAISSRNSKILEKIEITKKCDKCQKEFIVIRTKEKSGKINVLSKERKYCSLHCANSRIQTKEMNLKRSLKLLKEKPRCIQCKINRVKTSCRKYCSNNCVSKSFKNNVEFKLKTSKRMKESYKNGRKIYGGKTKWILTNTSVGEIYVQGSYEARVCKILDKWKNESKIKNWEYTKDRIKYIGIDNKEHFYLIDFKIFENDNSFWYLEVKGFKRENDDLKWNAVKNQGYNIDIWFKKDIEHKEIDDSVECKSY